MSTTSQSLLEGTTNNNNNNGLQYVINADVTINDVLLGRGDHSVKHVGNIRYRQIIESHLTHFLQAGNDNNLKNDIVRLVIATIRNRNGCFLRKATAKDIDRYKILPRSYAWIPIRDEATLLRKSKQAFRDIREATNKKKKAPTYKKDDKNEERKKDVICTAQVTANSHRPSATIRIQNVVTSPQAAPMLLSLGTMLERHIDALQLRQQQHEEELLARALISQNHSSSPFINRLVTNSLVTNGLAINGLAINGLAINGLAINGLATNSLASNGLVSNGLVSNGLASSGLTANGLAANGLTSNGFAANGLAAGGLVTSELVPDGFINNGLITNTLVANDLVATSLAANSLVANDLANSRLDNHGSEYYV